jgi:uncharacterized membrane protein
VGIYFAGRFLGGYLGRQIYDRLEKLLARVPGFKQVYPHVKQVVQMVIGDRPIAFNRVVMVEYPKQGIWTIGLVTGPSLRVISDEAGAAVITVFIPTTPTPFTGFAINVPASAVIDLPMSVEEAIRFFLTGGVVVPSHLANPAAAQTTARVGAAARKDGAGEIGSDGAAGGSPGETGAASEPGPIQRGGV